MSKPYFQYRHGRPGSDSSTQVPPTSLPASNTCTSKPCSRVVELIHAREACPDNHYILALSGVEVTIHLLLISSMALPAAEQERRASRKAVHLLREVAVAY